MCKQLPLSRDPESRTQHSTSQRAPGADSGLRDGMEVCGKKVIWTDNPGC